MSHRWERGNAVVVVVVGNQLLFRRLTLLFLDEFPRLLLRLRPRIQLQLVPLFLRLGLLFKDDPLGGFDALPFVGDAAREVREPDLPVRLAVLFPFDLLRDAVVDRRGFAVGNRGDDAGAFLLEEQVVGAQGSLRLVLWFLPGAFLGVAALVLLVFGGC